MSDARATARTTLARILAQDRKPLVKVIRQIEGYTKVAADAVFEQSQLFRTENVLARINSQNDIRAAMAGFGGSPLKPMMAPDRVSLLRSRSSVVKQQRLKPGKLVDPYEPWKPSASVFIPTDEGWGSVLALNGQPIQGGVAGVFEVVAVYGTEKCSGQTLFGEKRAFEQRALLARSVDHGRKVDVIFELQGEAFEEFTTAGLFKHGARFYKLNGVSFRYGRKQKKKGGPWVPWSHPRVTVAHREAFHKVQELEMDGHTLENTLEGPGKLGLDVTTAACSKSIDPEGTFDATKPPVPVPEACTKGFTAQGPPMSPSRDRMRTPIRLREFGGAAAKRAPRMSTSMSGTKITRSAPPKRRFGRSLAPSSAESITTTTRKLDRSFDDHLDKAIAMSIMTHENEQKARFGNLSPSEDEKGPTPEPLPPLTKMELDELHKTARASSSEEGPPDDRAMETDVQDSGMAMAIVNSDGFPSNSAKASEKTAKASENTVPTSDVKIKEPLHEESQGKSKLLDDPPREKTENASPAGIGMNAEMNIGNATFPSSTEPPKPMDTNLASKSNVLPRKPKRAAKPSKIFGVPSGPPKTKLMKIPRQRKSPRKKRVVKARRRKSTGSQDPEWTPK